MPDSVFGYGPVQFCCSFNDGGEVAAAAVFHENVENPSVSVNDIVQCGRDEGP